MKKIIPFLFLFLICSGLFAQEKVIKHDGDGKKWINTLEKGYIITSGTAGELELAQQQAIENVKTSIVQSVAEWVQVSSTQNTTELNGDVNSFLQSYQSETLTESGDVPFLQGISLSKVEGWYWEKMKDKESKQVYYRYYIRYPFSEQELNALIAAYQKNDRALTDRLNSQLAIIDHSHSLDEMVAANAQLREMTQLFKDGRKQQVRAGLATFNATLKSLAVVPIINQPGLMVVVLQAGDRVFTTNKNPRVSSACAEVNEIERTEEGVSISYSYDYCRAGSEQNELEFYYTLGKMRIKDKVRFDVTAYKVDLSMAGTIQMTLIDNLAKLSVPVKSAFNTTFSVSRIELAFSEDLHLFFELTDALYSGKGIQVILAEKALSPTQLKKIKNRTNKPISGRIFYTQTDTQIAGSYRIYKADIIVDFGF